MKFLILICAVFIISLQAAETSSKKKTICLNMIVKNESQVIERCLNSVKPLIDYWVIVDTGSTDNTREIIKRCMKGIPGKLYQKPWKNFAHNRNEALTLAKNKGDYVLLIDADEMLEFAANFFLPSLEKDLYYIPVRLIGLSDSKRNGLINNKLNWKWEGIIHEAITCRELKSYETLKKVVILCNTHKKNASGRSKESEAVKYLKDAEMLEKALIDEPNNSRYAYYLGISYGSAEKYELARTSFKKRVAMSSSDIHETFMAYYCLGITQAQLNEWDDALLSFANAFALRPNRAEPLLQSAICYRTKGDVLKAYQLIKQALAMPYPEDELCVIYVAYDYEMLIELANCALALGKLEEGLEACRKVLTKPHLPPEQRMAVQNNFELITKKLKESAPIPK